jgi:hypothetical protein
MLNPLVGMADCLLFKLETKRGSKYISYINKNFGVIQVLIYLMRLAKSPAFHHDC